MVVEAVTRTITNVLDVIVPGGTLITGFGESTFSFADGVHRGIDIGAKPGDPIYTPVSGTVVSGASFGLSPGYGNATTLLDDAGNLHIWGHSTGSQFRTGEYVPAFSQVSFISGTLQPGEVSASPHTHYEIRQGGDFAKQVNPLSFLQTWITSIPQLIQPQRPPETTIAPPVVETVTAKPAIPVTATEGLPTSLGTVPIFDTPVGTIKTDLDIWLKLLLTLICIILITIGVVKLTGKK